jgi:hypothetical protein
MKVKRSISIEAGLRGLVLVPQLTPMVLQHTSDDELIGH